MKNLNKKVIGILLVFTIVAGVLLTNTGVRAKEEKVFYPFRSYLVAYVTSHSNDEGTNICNQWLRLLYEENHYNLGESFYDPMYESWSTKYYSNYYDENKIRKSSKGVVVTYNPEFDYFFGNTLRSNDKFLQMLWDRGFSREILVQYLNLAIDYENVRNVPRPQISDALISLTADGAYIGTCKTDAENLIRKYQLDDEFIRIFAASYNKLSQKQKEWIKSYGDDLCEDYIANGGVEKSLALKSERAELYDAAARSVVAANSDKHFRQEFFDYIEGAKTGMGHWLAQIEGIDSDFSANALLKANAMEQIFSGRGYSINEVGPEAMDYFAYYIAFDKQIRKEPWLSIHELVINNSDANTAMEEWKKRYYELHKPGITAKWEADKTVIKNDLIYVATDQPIIRGTYKTCDSDLDAIYVNGAAAVVDEAQKSFSCKLPQPLVENEKTKLELSIVDKTENRFSEELFLIYDGSAPEIELDFDQEAAEENLIWSDKTEVTYVGRAWDECVGIENSTVFADISSKDTQKSIKCQVNDEDSFELPLELSEDFATKVEVYAVDELKHESEHQIFFFRADVSAPTIELDGEAEITVKTVNDLPNYAEIKGRAFDNVSGIKSFTIDGKEYELDADGRFQIRKYVDGSGSIEIEAEDYCGNHATLPVKITLDSVQAHKNFPMKPVAKMSGGLNGNNNAKYSDDYTANANAWSNSSSCTLKGRITGDMRVINCNNICYGTNGEYAHEQSKITLQVRSAIDDSIVDTQIMYNYLIYYHDTNYTLVSNKKNHDYVIPEEYKNGLYYYQILESYGSSGVEQGGWNRVYLTISHE